MSLVVDASVLVAASSPEPLSAAARASFGTHQLLAPDFLLVETANALWKKARRALITPTQAQAAITGLDAMFAQLVPSTELLAAALALALRRDHPAYDCFYVALAQREGAPLLTADTRLAERFANDAEIRLLA